MNLSQAVAAARRPGFAAAAAGRATYHGRSVVALSSSRRRVTDGGVACGLTNGYLGGSNTSLPVHGKSSASAADHVEGLGIQEFLGGKNFLITGGTGFLAKGMYARHLSIFLVQRSIAMLLILFA